jgi:hypothetical protein
METYKYHHSLDEAGDSTFYGKGKIPIIGTNGVSNVFILGMLTVNEPLPQLRERIIELQKSVETNVYYKNIPSVKKRVKKGGFYFHAKDDIPELRKEFYDFILKTECSLQVVVGRKIVTLFENKHNGNEPEFYADLLSHLIADKLKEKGKLVLNIAQKGSSTKQNNLKEGLLKAQKIFLNQFPDKVEKTKVEFYVAKFADEPLLAISDYLCWTIQRIFEKGETRFYEYMQSKIPLVIDLYDEENAKEGIYIYTKDNPLTEKNKVSPSSP